jgi:sec-independent protein translocase protein TatA
MGLGWSELLIALLVVVLLFGRGKISELMGDFAKGIKSFKKGLSDEAEEPQRADARTVDGHVAGGASAARDNIRVG